jgi:hypothetical protein
MHPIVVVARLITSDSVIILTMTGSDEKRYIQRVKEQRKQPQKSDATQSKRTAEDEETKPKHARFDDD